MKKIFVIFILVLTSCVLDPPKPKIALVKNLSNTNLVVIYGEDSITDNYLIYGIKHHIPADSMNTIYGPVPNTSSNKKISFYFFNSDTIYRYIKANIKTGIYSKSFLKKYTVESNKIGGSDTIFYP